ncbi:MAG TPA: DUF4010 domain-containing protein [Gammaproteobacteria bacterium]|nr:DUF4010 domain-containing protein [Gammaproteobacteria bacterium]
MNGFSLTALSGLLPSFAAALGAGLLIGIERERRKGRGAGRQLAGVRTFTLAALMGAVAHSLEEAWMVLLGGVLILALTAIRYAHDRSDDPGITTELALFVTYLLGVHAIEHPRFAAGAAVIVAALLYARQGLHRFSTELLSPTELRDALLLAGAALVVLPLIPATPLAWLGGLDPRRLWALAVLFMTLQGAGHIALRIFGPRLGLALGGLMSGFVSSAATTGALGLRARKEPALLASCVAGAWFSTVATAAQLAIVVLAIHPPGFEALRAPLLAMLASALVLAVVAMRFQHDAAQGTRDGHAFHLGASLGFAALLAGVTAAVGWIEREFGVAGAAIGIAFAGFADAHSAATSALSLAHAGALDDAALARCVFLAVTTNTVSKMLLAAVNGGWRYGSRTSAGLAAILAAAWTTLGLS